VTQQSTYSLHNVRVISTTVLTGSYLLVAAISFLLIISLSLHHVHARGSLFVCAIALLYLITTQRLMKLDHNHIAAYMLVMFYAMLASGIVWVWGINTPIALLIFALVIILAGILLTAYHALLAAALSGIVLLTVQTMVTYKQYMPNMSWSGRASSYGDALGYCIVFAMLALVSWLYNREMERSLAKATHAETALRKQKAMLNIQVEKRTAELRSAQFLEIQQMYRFMELGQLGVMLLHDLANYLTALALEIDALKSRQHAKTIARARQIMRYLEGVVSSTRDRLHGGTQKQTFDLVCATSDALKLLEYRAARANVTIDWQAPKRTCMYTADPMCYCQVVAIITGNAIDAYKTLVISAIPGGGQIVQVSLRRHKTDITLTIGDWGVGLTKTQREHLFEPHGSTKKTGLGIGLYIAKQTVEMQLSGTIQLNPQSGHTEFIIKLPLPREQ
jgi:signal transduction histidine kinase